MCGQIGRLLLEQSALDTRCLFLFLNRPYVGYLFADAIFQGFFFFGVLGVEDKSSH